MLQTHIKREQQLAALGSCEGLTLFKMATTLWLKASGELFPSLLCRVTRFECVKKRTLRRGTPPPPPRWSFWTYFSHADDPAPSPRRSYDICHVMYYCKRCNYARRNAP